MGIEALGLRPIATLLCFALLLLCFSLSTGVRPCDVNGVCTDDYFWRGP